SPDSSCPRWGGPEESTCSKASLSGRLPEEFRREYSVISRGGRIAAGRRGGGRLAESLLARDVPTCSRRGGAADRRNAFRFAVFRGKFRRSQLRCGRPAAAYR